MSDTKKLRIEHVCTIFENPRQDLIYGIESEVVNVPSGRCLDKK